MSIILDGTSGVTYPNGVTQAGGLPSPGTTGNVLTSNGTAWTSAAPAASGGMTLLGTLTTTSGTTQTLSGLTLTNYKFLRISVNNVGYSAGTTPSGLRMNTIDISNPSFGSTTGSVYGLMDIDLSIGATAGLLSPDYITTGSTNTLSFGGNGGGPSAGNLSTITTSTTSLAFAFSGGNTFASGTIKVYGVA